MLGSAFFAHRFGWSLLILIVPIAALSVIIGSDMSSSAVFISVIIMGGLSGLVVKNKISLTHYVLIVPVFTALLFSGDYYYQKIYNNYDLLADSKEQVVKYLEKSEASKEDKEAMLADVNVVLDVVRDIVPFTVFLYMLMFSALCYIVVKRFFIIFKKGISANSLSTFDINAYFVFVFILAWAFVLLAGREMGVFYVLALNGALIMSTLYFVQALGVLSFYMKKKNLPDYLLILLVVLIIFLSKGVGAVLAIILTGVGLLDLWADFRKIRIGKINA